jgi:hypothetical protein
MTTGGCILHLNSYFSPMTRCSKYIPYINQEVR